MAPARNTRSAKGDVKAKVTPAGQAVAEELQVHLSYQPGRKLGLVLVDNQMLDCSSGEDTEHVQQELERCIAISPRSIIFEFTHKIDAAANELFDLPILNKCDFGDIYLEGLIEFGRKNLPAMKFKCGSVELSDFNDEALRAVLSGKIGPGYLVREVQYTATEKRERGYYYRRINKEKCLCLEKRHNTPEKLAKFLRRPESYPVKVKFEQRPHNESKDKGVGFLEKIPNLDLNLEKIPKLDLNNSMLVRNANWGKLVDGLSRLKLLKVLDLGRNGIGMVGCAALAGLLKKNSLLKTLSLEQNELDDECIAILVKALKNNKTMEKLNLAKNSSISATGWTCILNLLCDKASIQSTYTSNHTLYCLGETFLSVSSSSQVRALSDPLREMLQINNYWGTKKSTAQRKLWEVFFHTNGHSFNLQPFLDVDVKLQPYILAWFASNIKHSSISMLNQRRLEKVYHIIRNWDVPTLLSFPSPERVRIGSRVTKLEAMVLKLQSENNELREKMESRSKSLKPRLSKRRRVS